MIVWLAASARLNMQQHARRYRLRETGGGPFGYEAEDNSLVIERATGPGPGAHHGSFRYRPDRQALQAEIDAELLNSGGRRYLLGEWHTHPLGRAVPSTGDAQSATRTANDDAVGLSSPVVLIQATLPWGKRVRAGHLGAFVWKASTSRLEAAEIRAFSRRR